MLKLGIIGGGNMGAAIISRTFSKYRIALCEKDKARCAVLKRKYRIALADLKTVVTAADVIILAVKPQDIDSVLAELKKLLTPRQMVISIAAGLTTAFLEKGLGKTTRVIRTMPNMPAQIGQGITALCPGRQASAKDLQIAVKLFSHIGETIIVDEKLMDSVTAVSGSGPAYLFLFIECFLKAAEKIGLKPEAARQLVNATLLGSVNLYLKSKEPSGVLRAKVTSKGGTTQAALDYFLDNNFEKMFADAVGAAKARARQLAR
ncbi:MAG: pyrroline-5-carboxylate reductase [Candidatus Omnitrophica bacterium]|nr:pyrroline-5-carboxylate reductase [Candidatus Omnitrophota bacterium]